MTNSARTNYLDNWAVDGMVESNYKDTEGRGLLKAVMKVEIAKGVKDAIHIHERDDSWELAKAFQ